MPRGGNPDRTPGGHKGRPYGGGETEQSGVCEDESAERRAMRVTEERAGEAVRRRCWMRCAARPLWWGPSAPGRRQEAPSGGRSSPKPSTPSPATSRGKPAWRRASWRMSCGGSCATGRPSAGTRGKRGKARSPHPPGCSTPSSTSTPTPWTTTPSRWCSHGSTAMRRAHGRCPPSCPSCWSTTTMSRLIRTTGGTSSNTARRPTVCFGTPRRRTAWVTWTSGRSTCSSCFGSRA